MTACMGGWCVVRDKCAHHQHANQFTVVERLCEPGTKECFEPWTPRTSPTPGARNGATSARSERSHAGTGSTAVTGPATTSEVLRASAASPQPAGCWTTSTPNSIDNVSLLHE